MPSFVGSLENKKAFSFFLANLAVYYSQAQLSALTKPFGNCGWRTNMSLSA